MPEITLDDVLLVPQYSEIESRHDVDLTTELATGVWLDLPILAANMDSVCEYRMAQTMAAYGGLGVIHRYMPPERQCLQVEAVRAVVTGDRPVAAAVGARNGTLEQVGKLLDAGASVIVVDVAHGHHRAVINTVKQIKQLGITVIAGNVATIQGALALEEAGADAIKVGVGPGSVCTTRIVTGHGFPQFSAVAGCANAVAVPVIADGGARTSGDIVKLLAAGASTVMIGSLLAGTEETPGEVFTDARGGKIKIFRGMSSADAQQEFFGNHSDAPEGVAITVPYRGSAHNVLVRLAAGIRSGLSYSGATSIKDLQKKATFVTITDAGKTESNALEG